MLSVIVPIFNEEKILWEMIGKLADNFDAIIGVGLWIFILVENGSTDGSDKIAHEIVERFPKSKIVRLPRPNYGRALRCGLKEVDTAFAHIINIEQWDIPFLRWAWRRRESYDLFMGSKRADPTINQQSPFRKILSWGLNSILQLLFEFPGVDTHGPKLLKMETMRPILEQCVMNRGQFDTEFTIRALRASLWVAEAPVFYQDHRPPRNFMITKILQNVFDLLWMRKMIQQLPYSDFLKLHRWSRVDLLAEEGCEPEKSKQVEERLKLPSIN